MIFSLVAIVLVGVIAYFHWVQGLFSGVISAVCALVAALMAFSYHEPLAQMLFTTKMTDQSYAIGLVLLFAVVYLVLRVTFDSLVPGNVRFPAIVDKVGGGLCGVFAGVFAVGTLATAAQTLPLSPSVAGYGRYQLVDSRDVKVSLSGRSQFTDSYVYEELKSDKINPDEADRMFLPVDEMVVGIVRGLSDGGSLEGARPLTAVHGSYLDEMFYNRLGVQVGARHVSVNTDKVPQAKAEAAYTLDVLAAVDGETSDIRNRQDIKQLKSNPQNVIVVIRVRFGAGGTDSDRVIRMSPASARLFAGGKNYLPEGTLERGVLVANRPDDFLFINSENVADFVYYVPCTEVFDAPTGGASAGAVPFKPGTFLEVKRMARSDLSTMQLATAAPSDAAVGVMRKPNLKLTPKTPAPAAAAPAQPGGASAAPAPAPEPAAITPPESSGNVSGGAMGVKSDTLPEESAPYLHENLGIGNSFMISVNVGDSVPNNGDVKLKGGTATLKDKQIAKLEIRPTDSATDVSTGPAQVNQLYIPPGTAMVQISGRAVGSQYDQWMWATKLGEIELVDAQGVRDKPNGAWAKVKKQDQERCIGKYDSENPIASIEKDDSTPQTVWIAFLIPKGTQLVRADFQKKKLADCDATVE